MNIQIHNNILELLKSNPGLKAREISLKLDIDKKEINSILYGDLKNKLYQDEKYCWYLLKDKPNNQEKKIITQNTDLTKICNYYLSCLSMDDSGGVSVFADSNFSLDYSELPNIPGDENFSLFFGGADKLIEKVKKSQNQLEAYFGYPCFIKKVSSPKWTGFKLEPVFLIPIDFSTSEPQLSGTLPIINLSVLKKITGSISQELMDELVSLETDLGMNNSSEVPDLDDLVLRLKDIKDYWSWKEVMEPNNINFEEKIKNIHEEGIYNKAVLLVKERSPYTQGLETELKNLSKLSPSQYENTALGAWIKGENKKDTTDFKIPLLEVLPLNFEQRQAIQQSIVNPITIVTGPPGTGKSQVVTNLIINAIWKGKKILFTSKNNKAVDVVETRVNNISSIDILLRMGSGVYTNKLAEYLVSLLNSNSSPHDVEEFSYDLERYEKIEKEFIELNKDEDNLIKVRNETDELDQIIEKIRNEFSESIYNEFKNINIASFGDKIKLLQKSFFEIIYEKQSFFTKIFWFFIKKSRYSRFNQILQNISEFISKLGIKNINLSSESDISEIEDFINELQKYLYYSESIQEYIDSLQKLQSCKSLEIITKEKNILIDKMSKNAKNLWDLWLRLSSHRLSDNDRKLLSQYKSLLKMVVDNGGTDLYKSLGRKIRAEYNQLSEKVSHLLPAWAITSLSAKGKVPFEPGFFDLVVFDEASQCDIASALPLLYRAKQVVIIGDPKQLSHISNINKLQDQQLLEKYDLIPDYANWAYSYNSLFDLASSLVSNSDIINLKDHHRSHQDIIEFSNQQFYGGNLRVATNYDKLKFIDSEFQGIRWIDQIGNIMRPESGGAVNKEEAKRIIDEIKSIIYDKDYKGTIGVVTPFRAQANYIDKIVKEDELFTSKLLNHEFLVDTVHKFQGDERDIMFFSPVISGKTPIGAINFLKNNGNLFNVAITRARAALIVVGDKNSILNSEISYLSNFAKYYLNIDTNKKNNIKDKLVDLGSEYPNVSNPERVSDREKIFYKALYKNGIKTIPQYQVEKYTLDLALFDGEKMLNIEIDGEKYHKSWNGELCRRDQIRNQRLYELGWDVKRFWVYEIRDDLNGCVNKIKNHFNN